MFHSLFYAHRKDCIGINDVSTSVGSYTRGLEPCHRSIWLSIYYIPKQSLVSTGQAGLRSVLCSADFGTRNLKTCHQSFYVDKKTIKFVK